MNKIITMLEELKLNYSEQLFQDTIEEIENNYELSNNIEEFSVAVNGQKDQFYDELAYLFKDDFELNPILYLIIWEQIISCFDNQTLNYFYNSCKSIDLDTNFTDFINGLMEMSNDNYELALLHFNRIDQEIAYFFLGICYFKLENDENSIKQNQLFIEYLTDFIENDIDKSELELSVFDDIYWNLYNDIAYSYIMLYDYNEALKYFEKSINIYDLEINYQTRATITLDNGLDDFQVFVNNYLLALEKSRNYSEALKVINFVIKKYPTSSYYENLKKEFTTKIENNNNSDEIIKRLFKPKKPFEISSFQSIKLLSKEKSLEDMIVEQIKYGINVFGKELEIYQDDFIYGRQYRIPYINGILDLLLIEKSTNQLYLVELKRNKAGIEVVDQIENYISALSRQLERDIKGIICLHKPNQALIDLVKSKENIDLFTYNFQFNQL
ncbi:endonuclease NucS domain-containing protein [Empedobacter falsenii]